MCAHACVQAHIPPCMRPCVCIYMQVHAHVCVCVTCLSKVTRQEESRAQLCWDVGAGGRGSRLREEALPGEGCSERTPRPGWSPEAPGQASGEAVRPEWAAGSISGVLCVGLPGLAPTPSTKASTGGQNSEPEGSRGRWMLTPVLGICVVTGHSFP